MDSSPDDLGVDSAHQPGSPEGMNRQEVNSRSDLATWISGTHTFPADRETLLERARSQSAPDGVVSAIRSLPDRIFENTEDVAKELGLGGGEQHA
jgi:hypothetical protein